MRYFKMSADILKSAVITAGGEKRRKRSIYTASANPQSGFVAAAAACKMHFVHFAIEASIQTINDRF